ncbi:MAG: rhodanese-like domain-containing protein [Caldimonas sp.]
MHELVSLLLDHGVLIIFAVTLAKRLGAPLPASPLLVIAGSLVVAGEISVAAVVAASLAANVIGDGAWFMAGRRYGHRVMKQLCRISLSPDSCVRQSESLITRWGGGSLIAAKFVPGVSVVAAPMSGALGMTLARFLSFEIVAALAWTSTFLILGMIFSDQVQRLFDLMESAGSVAIVLLVVAVAGLVAMRYWRRQRALRDLGMPRIGVDELHALMEQGKMPVVLDVRSDASTQLDARRIPGAIAVNLGDIPANVAEFDAGQEIVVYCSCPNEVSSARAAGALAATGRHRVRPLAGGLDAWVDAGWATEPVAATPSPSTGHCKLTA